MNYLFFLVIGLYHISIRYKMIPLVIRITDKYTIIPDFEKEAMYFPKRITFFTRSTSVGCLRKAPGFRPMSIGGEIRGGICILGQFQSSFKTTSNAFMYIGISSISIPNFFSIIISTIIEPSIRIIGTAPFLVVAPSASFEN